MFERVAVIKEGCIDHERGKHSAENPADQIALAHDVASREKRPCHLIDEMMANSSQFRKADWRATVNWGIFVG
jgi:hypothetical protein